MKGEIFPNVMTYAQRTVVLSRVHGAVNDGKTFREG